MLVRPETPDDHDAIRLVVIEAFGSRTDADVDEADLVDRIRASTGYVAETSLVAEEGGAVVGHVMISDATLVHASGRRRIAMLSPLSVHPDHQRRGIGSALVRAATQIADERGEPLVILEGDPGYYGRLGFEHSVGHGIEIPLPDWAPPEAAQVILLSSYDPHDPTLRGTAVYPPAFDGIE